jgi:hypothetical protein
MGKDEGERGEKPVRVVAQGRWRTSNSSHTGGGKEAGYPT